MGVKMVRRVMDFRVEVDDLGDGLYNTRLTTTETKRVFEKRGVRPLWDILRLVKRGSEHNQPDGCGKGEDAAGRI